MCGVAGNVGAEFVNEPRMVVLGKGSATECPPRFEECPIGCYLDELSETIFFCIYVQVQTSRHRHNITLSRDALVIPKRIGASLGH